MDKVLNALKDLMQKVARNDRPQFMRNEWPRLHDKPYKTSWKGGRPIDEKKETPDLLKKKNNHFVDDTPWCVACNLPHSPLQCIIAQNL